MSVKALHNLTPADLGIIQSALDEAKLLGDDDATDRVAMVLVYEDILQRPDADDTAYYIVHDLKRDLGGSPRPTLAKVLCVISDTVGRRFGPDDEAAYSGVKDTENARVHETDELIVILADNMVHAYYGPDFMEWDGWVFDNNPRHSG